MPAEKFLKHNAGALVETAGATTGGAPDADRIPALDASGRLAPGMMPPGIGADTSVIQASEALAAGDLVNVHNVGGARVRKADATAAGKEAMGFVLSAVANGANATVYFEGANAQVTGLTPGRVFLSTTPGLATSAPPAAAGNIVQVVGFATGATSLNFNAAPPITLA